MNENGPETIPEPVVVYVSRKNDANGVELLSKFIESYLAHPAGWPHRLFFVKKGYSDFEDQWRKALAPLSHLDYGVLEVPDRNYCLGYHRQIMQRDPGRYYLLLTSHSRILVDGWLERYMRHAAPNRLLGMGLVWLKKRPLFDPARRFLGNLARRFLLGKDEEGRFPQYPLLPTPAVRTNGFLVPPHILDRIVWPTCEELPFKENECYFECGTFSLSFQAIQAGMDLFLVGADGEKYPLDRWYEGETYYPGPKRNAVFSDNRTRAYVTAPASDKEYDEGFYRNRRGDPGWKRIPTLPSTRDHSLCPGCMERGHRRAPLTPSHFRCVNCGTIFSDPMPENSSAVSLPATIPDADAAARDMLNLVRKYAPPGGDCLEIAPTGDRIARILEDAAYRIARLETESPDPAQSLRTSERRWDAILAFHSMERLRNPVDVFFESTDKLKPGGVFIAALPDYWTLACRLFPESAGCLVDSSCRLRIPVQTYVRHAREFGLDLVESIRDDAQSRAINEFVWSWIETRPAKPVRSLFGLCLSILNRAKMLPFPGRSRAAAVNGRMLMNLERALGKSNAYTLVFRKSNGPGSQEGEGPESNGTASHHSKHGIGIGSP